jgi:hypothetical protein
MRHRGRGPTPIRLGEARVPTPIACPLHWAHQRRTEARPRPWSETEVPGTPGPQTPSAPVTG